MALFAKYYVTSPSGVYIDWSSYNGFSLEGQEGALSGGVGADYLSVGIGNSFDARDFLGSSGNDVLYLTGSLSHYTQSVDSNGVYTLTRTAGLIAGQTEVVKFSSGPDDDVVYFADGHVNVGFLAAQPNSQPTLMDVNGAFRQLTSLDLLAGGTPSTLPVPSLTVPPLGTEPTKVYIFTSVGLDIPQLPVSGQALTASGGFGADSYYVKAGTSANAIDLMGSSGNDKLYLTGSFSDYSQSVDGNGVYVFTRTVGLQSGQSEIVKFASGVDDDSVYFADGHVVIGMFSAQPNGGPSLIDSNGAFRLITMQDIIVGATPGLNQSDIQTITVDAGNSTGGQNNYYNAGDTITFAVTMKSAVDVNTNSGANKPKLAINVGGSTVYAIYDSTLTGGDTNKSLLKFKYVVGNTDNDGDGVSIIAGGANTSAIDLNSSTISLTGTLSAAKIVGSPTMADNASYKVDTTLPNVLDANISISGATGTGGVFKVGDTVTAVFNPTGHTDLQSVTVDFTSFGATQTVNAILQTTGTYAGKWLANYTVVAGNIDANNKNISVTATDMAGNSQTTADTSNAAVDNIAPTISFVNAVTQLDARSDIGLSFNQAISLGSTGHIILKAVTHASKTGYHGASAPADIDIDLANPAHSSWLTLGAGGTSLSIHLPGNLDLNTSYEIHIDAGVVVDSHGNTNTAMGAGTLGFQTISPTSTGQQAVMWNAATASYDIGAYWYDAAQGSFAEATGAFSLDMSAHASEGSVLVLGRDVDTSRALVLDTGSYLSLTNWGSKDSLYIDTKYAEANDVDTNTVAFLNGATAGTTTLQFASSALGGAGVDFTLAAPHAGAVVTSFSAAGDLTSFESLGLAAKPVITG